MPRGQQHPREYWQEMGRKGGRRSIGRQCSQEEWRQLGREGGRVSGMVRREPVEREIEAYEEIARTQGFRAALILCRKRSWKLGYYARCRGERRDEVQ